MSELNTNPAENESEECDQRMRKAARFLVSDEGIARKMEELGYLDYGRDI